MKKRAIYEVPKEKPQIIDNPYFHKSVILSDGAKIDVNHV
jgi:hypothetical protein